MTAIETLRQARCDQLGAKRKLAAAKREYEIIKAKTYLKSEGGHYLILAQVTTHPDVIKAREDFDEAERLHFLAWSEANLAALSLNYPSSDDPEESENSLPGVEET